MKLTGIPFDTHRRIFPEFINLLWHLKFEQQLGEEILELVIMVAWSIWYNQNEVRQGKLS